MTYRHLTHAALLALLAGGLGVAPVVAQTPDEVRQTIRTEAAPYGNGERLVSVVGCETGQTYAATSVGDGGTSFGIAQLHRGGLLDSGPSSFYGRGHTDPFDVQQAARYMAWAFANGLAGHWSCAR